MSSLKKFVGTLFMIHVRFVAKRCILLLAAQIFDELLLDADWSTNAGMWMWLSSSSFFHQFYYTYDPVSFGKRIDVNGDYIR